MVVFFCNNSSRCSSPFVVLLILLLLKLGQSVAGAAAAAAGQTSYSPAPRNQTERKCFADKKNVMWTCADGARGCQEKKRKTFAQAEELVEMCVAVVAQ